MKFPKHIRLNWITFLCLVIFALVGVVFLGLIWNYRSDGQKATARAKPVPHAHTHPHDGDDSHPHTATPNEEAPTDTETSKEVPKDTENKANTEKSGRKLGVKGVFAAFQTAIDLRDTDPALADKKVHAIAQELGDGDPEWTEFYHLTGHILLAAPPGTTSAYLEVDDGVRYYALKEKLVGLTSKDEELAKRVRMAFQWKRDGDEVARQIEPIIEVRKWMQENVPTEWEVVNTRYFELLDQWDIENLDLKSHITIQQRVDNHYENFFEALQQLPEDSQTFRLLFESPLDEAQESLLSEQKVIQTQPPLPLETETSAHTWDMVHETPPADVAADKETTRAKEISIQLPETPQPLGVENLDNLEKMFSTNEGFETTLQDQFSPDRFNRAIETLRQHGSTEGLQRLKETDPAMAAAIEKQIQGSQ